MCLVSSSTDVGQMAECWMEVEGGRDWGHMG